MSCGASCELRCSAGDGCMRRLVVRASSRGWTTRAGRLSPLARRRPISEAGPAPPVASTAPWRARRGSRPGSGRSPCRCTAARPRVGSTGPPARRSSTRRLADCGGLVVEELPVDHHDGREVAGRVALDVLEGDLAVLGGLAVADAEVLLERLEDGVAAHHRAQRVGADADLVVAGGLAPVHRVEGGDRGDLGGGQAEHLGAEPHAGAGDMALLRLHEVQQRQQGGPGVRVAGDDLLRRPLRAGRVRRPGSRARAAGACPG